MISIRESTKADGPAIAEARRASWQAAYAGIIRQRLIDQVTARPAGAAQPAPWRRTLVAVPDDPDAPGEGSRPAVVGYASFGPERSLPTLSPGPSPASVPGAARRPPPASRLTEAGLAGQVGEVYALYVIPDWWSTGTGRSLMCCAVAALSDAGYQRAVLWVLEANARARRFYERVGWVADGSSSVLTGLGGVVEVRYSRPL